VEQFSSITSALKGFVESHGWKAEARRRSVTGTAEGFTLAQATRFLGENIPGLYEAGISTDTVARLFHAPRKGTTSARKHFGLVDARVARKRNDQRPVPTS
jgi:hypothetical protein